MIKPVLILGFGNPSRGDDALGPLLLDYIEQHNACATLELLTDFQLQVEHALDLEHRQLVLFIDASVACQQAFAFTELQPLQDNSYSSHAMSPAAVLHVYQTVSKQPLPPSFLLSIQATEFELGSDLSALARQNLSLAQAFVDSLLDQPQLEQWRGLQTMQN